MAVNTSDNKTETVLQQEKVVAEQPEKQLTKEEENKQQSPKEETKQDAQAAEDPNWRAFREARKKDRAEREAAEKRAMDKEAEVTALKAAMEAAFAKGTNIAPNAVNSGTQQYEYGQEETEDERIEKKVQAAMALRDTAAERQRLEREQQEYPQRLNQTFNDFHQTISQDNLDYLDYHYPEVSTPLQRLPDGFDKWADIYKAVKKFVPNNGNSKKDAARAEANYNKPKSMSGPTIMQPGEATTSARLTEEKRAANWERMQKILKGLS